MTLPGRPDEAPPANPHRAGRARRGGLMLVIASGVVAVDQWTKSWAQQSLSPLPGGRRHLIGPVYLALTYNRGAAFSLGSGASPLIGAVAVIFAVVVVAYSGRVANGGAARACVVGLGLLSGGALSNLVDRLVRHHHGGVVDFVQLVSWWPVFNVADAGITAGAVTVGVTLVFFSPPKRPAINPGPSSSGPAVQGRPTNAARLSGGNADRD